MDTRYPIPVSIDKPIPRFVAPNGVIKSPMGTWVPIEYVEQLAEENKRLRGAARSWLEGLKDKPPPEFDDVVNGDFNDGEDFRVVWEWAMQWLVRNLGASEHHEDVTTSPSTTSSESGS